MRSVVRIYPDPPSHSHQISGSPGVSGRASGAIAQLGERLLCKQEVVGSIPSGSTIFPGAGFLLERTADAHVGVRIGGSCLVFPGRTSFFNNMDVF